MDDSLHTAVIVGLLLTPIFGTVAGWLHEEHWLRSTRVAADTCPACGHPEHWPWCRVAVEGGEPCWCDLFTEPRN